MIDRVPPQNIEAEQSVLGSMLIQHEAIAKVMEKLRGEAFYREAHRHIYEAIIYLFEHSNPVDLVTVVEQLREMGKLEEAGGLTYVTSLANSVPTAANVGYYAGIVAEKALLRSLINTSTEIAAMGYEAAEDVNNILDKSEQMIFDIAQNRTMTRDFQHIKDVVISAMDSIENSFKTKGGLTGLATGFSDFDVMTAGLQQGDLIILAARPSMGKTAFCLNIAYNIARKQQPVAFFSLEMGKEQLVQRLLSSDAGIDAQRLRSGDLHDEDWTNLGDSMNRLAKASLYIDDAAGIQVMDIRAKARRLAAERGLGLIVIDYLQLIRGNGNSQRENRQQEVSEISRSLKALARELSVPVIALSQLSRGVESRTNKRPMLSDLRESGSLEQDADIVAFLYREDYYNPDIEEEQKNLTELIISKQRNGPVGTVQLMFNKACTRFNNVYRG